MNDLVMRLRIYGNDWAEGHPSKALAYEAADRIAALEAQVARQTALADKAARDCSALSKMFNATEAENVELIAAGNTSFMRAEEAESKLWFAADRIRELEAEVARLKRNITSTSIAWDSTPAENERLRAEVARLREQISAYCNEGEDDPFDTWIQTLTVDVIQKEYGFEPGEFTVYPDHWRSLYERGLTPSQAYRHALDVSRLKEEPSP